jgi:hypothetical protein
MTIDTTPTPLGANPSTDQHPATAPGQGIVHVLTARRYRRQAVCTCSYTGKRRLWGGIAVLDALTHASSCGCAPAVPLVTPSPRDQHRCARHPHRWPAHPARRRRRDHTERASTNSDDDGHER